MKKDVADYMRYYNNDRLHTANGGMSPVKYEMSHIKVSGSTCPEQLSMARLKSARFLTFRDNCSLIRIAQISLSLSGAFCPTSLPLFQGSL